MNTTMASIASAKRDFMIPILSPAARKIAAEKNIDPKKIQGTGKNSRITKQDAVAFIVQKPIDMEKTLKNFQNSGTMLTTFNEIDMFQVTTLLDKYKENFQAQYGINLNLMFFFEKACTKALQEIPKFPDPAIVNDENSEAFLSIPCLNSTQSAVLGLYKIEKRMTAVNDTLKIRPMMYVALSYNYQVIDDKEAIQFLRTIKGLIEKPIGLIINY